MEGEITTTAPDSSTDYLLTYIIPAVIIIGMLILAILLACLLRKKQQAGKLNLFYSESLPPRIPVILKEDVKNGDQLCFISDDNTTCKPVMLPCAPTNIRHHEKNSHETNNVPEFEKLLRLEHAPINIDPMSLKGMSRPSPIYQKRHK